MMSVTQDSLDFSTINKTWSMRLAPQRAQLRRDVTTALSSTIQGTDQPNGNAFSDAVLQPNESYKPGDTVCVDFQSSSPNSDLKTGSSFLLAERKTATGGWNIIYRDAAPETTYNWRPNNPAPQSSPSSSHIAKILWRIQRNTRPGTYRIPFEGVTNQASLLLPYEGNSNESEITGPVADCP